MLIPSGCAVNEPGESGSDHRHVSFACPGFKTVAAVMLQLNNTHDQHARFKHTVRYSRRVGRKRAGDGNGVQDGVH